MPAPDCFSCSFLVRSLFTNLHDPSCASGFTRNDPLSVARDLKISFGDIFDDANKLFIIDLTKNCNLLKTSEPIKT